MHHSCNCSFYYKSKGLQSNSDRSDMDLGLDELS